jgi:hypothetical protein
MPAEATGVALEQVPALAPLLGEKRWCCWRWEWKAWRRGEAHKGAWTKVPWFPAGKGPGQPLQTSHPEQARSYAVARDMVLRGDADGVGWVVTGETEWVWLDLDKCLDPKGAVAPWAEAVLERVRAIGLYTEISPSGQGLRVLGRAGLDAPMQGRVDMTRLLAGLDEDGLKGWGGSRECHKLAGVEIFFACVRYVTMTGWGARGAPGSDGGGLAMELWQLAEGQKGAARKGRASKALPGEDKRAPIEDVVSALSVITNDDGWDVPVSWEEWNRIGMAVFAATGGEPEGLEAWMAWSARSELKHVPAACEERWAHWTSSSPPTEIGFGALAIAAGEATRNRWRRPSRAPSVEFEREPEEGRREGEKEGEETEAERTNPAPFAGLLRRVSFVVEELRWFDAEKRRVMKLEGLQHLAGRMTVKGHANTGAKSIAARLHAHPDLVVLVGLGCYPGQGPIVEGVNESGERGLCGNFWKRGGVEPTDADPSVWLELVNAVIEDEVDRERVLDRLAWMLQHPGKKANGALVLVGPQGAGKDTLLVPFWAAVGEHNMAVVQGNVIGGDFTEYLKRQYVFITEMPPAHKRDRYEEIKSWLATPPDRLAINEKNHPRYTIPNIVNVVITTNHISAVALADDDRRFDVVQTRHAVGEADGRPAYFNRVYPWFAAGGSAAVAGWLLRRDVSRFNPSAAPPYTRAKAAMTREGAHPATGWVMDVLMPRGPMGRRNLVTVIEIMDLARHGGWGAGAAVASWILPEHITRGLRLSGWRHVARTEIEGARHQVWARANCPVELLKQLPGRSWAVLLEEDRKKSAASEF